MKLKGIHHVSAITASAAENYMFYTKVMGMRLVKKSVNQDDVSVYHLYYGDQKGTPGTALTFFEFPGTSSNREGISSISLISFRVRDDKALEYFARRFDEFGVWHEDIAERAGRKTLYFKDPEGQRLMLVSDNGAVSESFIPWELSSVPIENQIMGLGPVRLTVKEPGDTLYVLTEIMGYRLKGSYRAEVQGQKDIIVLETGEGGSGTEIHLEERSDLPFERQGYGGVHHVAFRVEDEAELREWISRIDDNRIRNSGFVERFYFKSLYFREPNGILFELATDGPGFDTDEELEFLGERLSLPPFLENRREYIEKVLKPLDTAVRRS
ncbi:ring-cleaving dioxygenase [Youngiibacter fragilis]|uniref:Glyoxalase n=1 Tax=Youngiibacter fragilis 232.1 TaxID=994573 RepID=V7HZW1_9CLOT|nr:ring-cleaving dioxygenase [Youngiibacter fragilis]ETA79148.1 glyoxalase [Youngiibacter fragilis 232.1]